MKHTQGKWNVKEVRENLNGLSSFVSYQVVSDDEVVIAKETTEDNANLIASAPKMLEALKYINKECVKMNRGDYDETPEKIDYVFSGIWKKAEEAIAKAEEK